MKGWEKQALHLSPLISSARYISAMAQPAKSILWVNDETELYESHRIFLQDNGFEVERATNAADTGQIVRRRPFNLVLLDAQMPGTRGLKHFASFERWMRSSPLSW